MKLNFWQWLGVALFILGVILVFRSRMGSGTDDTVQTQTTQPTR
jgi:drug/metabolite transporter (DMT)-like permease